VTDQSSKSPARDASAPPSARALSRWRCDETGGAALGEHYQSKSNLIRDSPSAMTACSQCDAARHPLIGRTKRVPRLCQLQTANLAAHGMVPALLWWAEGREVVESKRVCDGETRFARTVSSATGGWSTAMSSSCHDCRRHWGEKNSNMGVIEIPIVSSTR
jgi:hypothetical protein